MKKSIVHIGGITAAIAVLMLGTAACGSSSTKDSDSSTKSSAVKSSKNHKAQASSKKAARKKAAAASSKKAATAAKRESARKAKQAASASSASAASASSQAAASSSAAAASSQKAAAGLANAKKALIGKAIDVTPRLYDGEDVNKAMSKPGAPQNIVSDGSREYKLISATQAKEHRMGTDFQDPYSFSGNKLILKDITIPFTYDQSGIHFGQVVENDGSHRITYSITVNNAY